MAVESDGSRSENPYAAPVQLEYDPGRVSWGQFLYAAALTLICAGVLALALHFAFSVGLYVSVLAPAIAALVLSAILFWTIQSSHCRSRALAVLIAVVGAMVMYWGQYYCDMLARGGRNIAHRVDLLPQYIAWRKTIEKQHRIGPPLPAKKPDRPDPAGLNWFLSVMELMVVGFITIGTARAAASRPYCDHCGRWMHRDADFLPSGADTPLLGALEKDSLGDLLKLPSISPMSARRFTAVTVSWCPPRRSRKPHCPAFLSIKAVYYGGGLGQVNQIDLAFGRTRLYMRPLTTRQIAELRPRFMEMSYAAVGCDAVPPDSAAS